MYCTQRFRNEYDAECHQNGLHLRKHSWSCTILNDSFDGVFYSSSIVSSADNKYSRLQSRSPSSSPTAFDVCGYCGLHFPNEPAPDWKARGIHLNGVHHFGQCNRSKKFFRVDHFRRHLKHSHAATIGEWTNELETACIRDEPPLNPREHNDSSCWELPSQIRVLVRAAWALAKFTKIPNVFSVVRTDCMWSAVNVGTLNATWKR